MNRLGKILTLGLEKKRAWQLLVEHSPTRRSHMKPIVASFVVLWGPDNE